VRLFTVLRLLESRVRHWRRPHAHNHGNDDVPPAPSEPAQPCDEQIRREWLREHSKTGLEEVAVRAVRAEQDEYEQARRRIYPHDADDEGNPLLTTHQTVYGKEIGITFTDEVSGGCIFATDSTLVEMEDER
jgi:hypothetical protein